jgi:hypothetical protein
MRTAIVLLMLLTILVAVPLNARSDDELSLESYSCAQFLNDVARPDSGRKVLRPIMMIAWATGYASAHQQGKPRTDAISFKLISAALGDACRERPNALAASAFVESIDQMIK